MGLITKMRSQMQVVMWTILVLFVTSMAIGGLVGGASITDIFGQRQINEIIALQIGNLFTCESNGMLLHIGTSENKVDLDPTKTLTRSTSWSSRSLPFFC